MAGHLDIFGTEKDRENCVFFSKVGACRHGNRCSRLHNRPTISNTLLLSNMYQRPDMITPGVDAQGQPIDPRKIQEHFEAFYEYIFKKLSKFGEIESLNVCDNLLDHMIGNVYVQFREEDEAAAALQALQGRFYSGRPIIADFSPVTDFHEATCRQYEENNCNRGGHCNFVHVKVIGRELRSKLFGRTRRSRGSRSRSRSASPRHRPDREFRDRDRERDRDRDRDDHRDRNGRRPDRYDRDSGSRGRHGSPRRSRSPPPAREGSEERRARIEQWNREREEKMPPSTQGVGSSRAERRHVEASEHARWRPTISKRRRRSLEVGIAEQSTHATTVGHAVVPNEMQHVEVCAREARQQANASVEAPVVVERQQASTSVEASAIPAYRLTEQHRGISWEIVRHIYDRLRIVVGGDDQDINDWRQAVYYVYDMVARLLRCTPLPSPPPQTSLSRPRRPSPFSATPLSTQQHIMRLPASTLPVALAPPAVPSAPPAAPPPPPPPIAPLRYHEQLHQQRQLHHRRLPHHILFYCISDIGERCNIL